jgi:S-adenosylmethionine:tRNA ribosyltransferase-isomerase
MTPGVAELHPAIDFSLPQRLEASTPPEARGLARDQVRLLVAWRHRRPLAHTIFHQLPRYLDPGDLLVVNNSATLPASTAAVGPDGTALELHFATRLDSDLWVVEPRRAARPASRPFPEAERGMVVGLAGGGRAELLAPHGTPGRLWVAALDLPAPVEEWLVDHGAPIRYRYVPREWPIDYYQTVFAVEPGSAEMPSAARPFSAALVTELVSRGIAIAPITLHCGVSSPEAHEAPMAERFSVPESTADLVNVTRRRGNRVIAVGTTVVRALETAAAESGVVHAAHGWTELVIAPERPIRAVDGMITGWHEPAASHLAMLEAVAGGELLARSYRAALACGYLWHEFGDSHLILP